MTPKVIRTQADHEAALSRIDALMDARPGTSRGEELDLLVTLAELYEREAFPIAPPSALDAIRFRMEQTGLLPRDLGPYIGSRSKVSEVLRGKRRLSLRMIRSLHEGLGIPAEALLQQDTASVPPSPARARSSRRVHRASRLPRQRPPRRAQGVLR